MNPDLSQPDPRITCDDDGSLDDFYVTEPVAVHFERLDDNEFWVGVTLRNGQVWHINCGAGRPSPPLRAPMGYSRIDRVI